MDIRTLMFLKAASGGGNADKVVLIDGYAPERRSSSGPAATLNKQAGTSSKYYCLGMQTADTTKYPIESKDNIDTGDWYLVPIVLPEGATGFTISTEDELKSRVLWFDNTQKETVNNKGAKVLEGKTGAQGLDQEDYVKTYTYTKPSTQGINSFCCAVLIHNHQNDVNTNHMELITFAYTYE